MKFLRTFLLVLMMLSIVCPALAAEITPEQRAEADAFFTGLFEKSQAVGGIFLLSQGGDRLYSYAYGYGDRGKTRPVTEETVYKVASVTKMITAIGVMQLVEDEILSLDAPLAASDGTPIRHPRYPDTPITLRMIMSHTASFLSEAPYAVRPRWRQIDMNSGYFAPWAPGSRYEYANIDGGFLGSQIEWASGRSLNDYMRDHVFSPLSINAAYAAALLPSAGELSDTFRADGSLYKSAASYLADDADYDNTCDPDRHYRTSVGSLYISAQGLEKLGLILACGEAEGVRLFSEESARMMRLDQRLIPDGGVTADSPYGLCVYRYDLGWDQWYGHQGRWEGLLTDVFFEPYTRTVMVFIANGVKKEPGREISAHVEKILEFIAPWTDFIVE